MSDSCKTPGAHPRRFAACRASRPSGPSRRRGTFRRRFLPRASLRFRPSDAALSSSIPIVRRARFCGARSSGYRVSRSRRRPKTAAARSRPSEGCAPRSSSSRRTCPDLSGFDVVAAFPRETRPAFVLLTSREMLAVRAFEVDAADCVVKPFASERIAAALTRARGAHAANEGETGRSREAAARGVAPRQARRPLDLRPRRGHRLDRVGAQQRHPPRRRRKVRPSRDDLPHRGAPVAEPIPSDSSVDDRPDRPGPGARALVQRGLSRHVEGRHRADALGELPRAPEEVPGLVPTAAAAARPRSRARRGDSRGSASRRGPRRSAARGRGRCPSPPGFVVKNGTKRFAVSRGPGPRRRRAGSRPGPAARWSAPTRPSTPPPVSRAASAALRTRLMRSCSSWSGSAESESGGPGVTRTGSRVSSPATRATSAASSTRAKCGGGRLARRAYAPVKRDSASAREAITARPRPASSRQSARRRLGRRGDPRGCRRSTGSARASC